jgi:hypothetical protein
MPKYGQAWRGADFGRSQKHLLLPSKAECLSIIASCFGDYWRKPGGWKLRLLFSNVRSCGTQRNLPSRSPCSTQLLASTALPHVRISPRSAPTWCSFPLYGIWPVGLGYAPATMRAPASASRAEPGTEVHGCEVSSLRLPGLPRVPRAPISHHCSGGLRSTGARSEFSSRSRTLFWSSPGICSQAAGPTRILAPTTSSVPEPNRPNAITCGNSNTSATPLPFNFSRPEHKEKETFSEEHPIGHQAPLREYDPPFASFRAGGSQAGSFASRRSRSGQVGVWQRFEIMRRSA